MIIEQQTKWAKNRRKVSKKQKNIFMLQPAEKIADVERYPLMTLKATQPKFDPQNDLPCVYIEEIEQAYVYEDGAWRVFKGSGDPPVPDPLQEDNEHTSVMFDYENDPEIFQGALTWCEAKATGFYKLAEVKPSMATAMVLAENDLTEAQKIADQAYNEPIMIFKKREDAELFEKEFASKILETYDINDQCDQGHTKLVV